MVMACSGRLDARERRVPMESPMSSKQALIGETMVQLADNLVTDFDVVELLTMLADRCVSILGVSAASLMLAGPDGNLRVIASSSEKMHMLELFELQADEGPCLESFLTGTAVTQNDLSTATARWPKFAAEAMSNGFRSVYAIPMRLRGNVIGALNLFHSDAHGIDIEGITAASAFADVATIAILQHRATIAASELMDQLSSALNTRIVIEQAKGIVAEREHLDMEHAFAALRHHARNNNLRLTDVAAAVVSGTLEPSAIRHAPTSPSHPGRR